MEFVQNNLMWIALALFSGGTFIWQTLRSQGVKNISPIQATLLINREDAVVVDVREANEFAAGHIPNARAIPLGQLQKRVGELEKFQDKPVIACCQSGSRSANACAILKKAGFGNVLNLTGGVPGWQDANLPITKK